MESTSNHENVIRPAEGMVDFAFRVYAKPELKNMCLRLQDDYHSNINILLWCSWLEYNSMPLSAQWLDDVLISVDTLSQLTVSRLREVRHAIDGMAGFTRVQAKLINKHILNAELAAEKIFLQRLQDLTSRFSEADIAAGFNVEENVPLTVQHYLDFLHVPNARIFAETLTLLVETSAVSNQ